ncbi:hypothetical protein SAMN06298216_1695 [Spirosomataceae bacterium TFI 002]|nr:hypothetical protein SAMN06298216_1695 [Spirosomataceae bacterium TFI 002]
MGKMENETGEAFGLTNQTMEPLLKILISDTKVIRYFRRTFRMVVVIAFALVLYRKAKGEYTPFEALDINTIISFVWSFQIIIPFVFFIVSYKLIDLFDTFLFWLLQKIPLFIFNSWMQKPIRELLKIQNESQLGIDQFKSSINTYASKNEKALNRIAGVVSEKLEIYLGRDPKKAQKRLKRHKKDLEKKIQLKTFDLRENIIFGLTFLISLRAGLFCFLDTTTFSFQLVSMFIYIIAIVSIISLIVKQYIDSSIFMVYKLPNKYFDLKQQESLINKD